MGRKKRKTIKSFDFDDFSLDIDTYKKNVVFFHLKFMVKRDSKEKISTDDLKRQMEALLREKFNNVQGRKIFDVDTGEIMKGYVSHIQLSVYMMLFDDYEEYIIGKCQEMLPQIREMFSRAELYCVKPTKYGSRKNEKGILEGNTEL